MYSRMLQPPEGSFFLLGPRGVGKSAWLKQTFPRALVFDLLDDRVWNRLLADPVRLGEEIPANHDDWVVVDEVQRAPQILNEVHRLIESRRLRFALTGSSARKLRRRGVNLLAGRAATCRMHPLVADELAADFDLTRLLSIGGLPGAWGSRDPASFLQSYVATWLREEVFQEGFSRNIEGFGRFLEAASFSQGAVLNMASVARDCSVSARVVETYFQILDDLLIGFRLPAFTRRAKRRVVQHPKFYYFDAGVFQAIRLRGPLDSAEEVRGPALETVVLHHLRAHNDGKNLGYAPHYWRTPAGKEVDFVLYGPRGLRAFEVKASRRLRDGDLDGLVEFLGDYPMAKATLLYLGDRSFHERGVDVVPATAALARLGTML